MDMTDRIPIDPEEQESVPVGLYLKFRMTFKFLVYQRQETNLVLSADLVDFDTRVRDL